MVAMITGRGPRYTGGGGGGFRAAENMNLQILARQNLCHFFKMSEQIMLWFPVIAHEKQWALTVISWWT